MQILAPLASLFEQKFALVLFTSDENCSFVKQIIDMRNKQPISCALSLSCSFSSFHSLCLFFFFIFSLYLFFFPILSLYILLPSLSSFLISRRIRQYFVKALSLNVFVAKMNESIVQCTVHAFKRLPHICIDKMFLPIIL